MTSSECNEYIMHKELGYVFTYMFDPYKKVDLNII